MDQGRWRLRPGGLRGNGDEWSERTQEEPEPGGREGRSRDRHRNNTPSNEEFCEEIKSGGCHRTLWATFGVVIREDFSEEVIGKG